MLSRNCAGHEGIKQYVAYTRIPDSISAAVQDSVCGKVGTESVTRPSRPDLGEYDEHQQLSGIPGFIWLAHLTSYLRQFIESKTFSATRLEIVLNVLSDRAAGHRIEINRNKRDAGLPVEGQRDAGQLRRQ